MRGFRWVRYLEGARKAHATHQAAMEGEMNAHPARSAPPRSLCGCPPVTRQRAAGVTLSLRTAGVLRTGVGLALLVWPAPACAVLRTPGAGGRVVVRALGFRHVAEGILLGARGTPSAARLPLSLDAAHLASLVLWESVARSHHPSAARLAALAGAMSTLTVVATQQAARSPGAQGIKPSDGQAPADTGTTRQRPVEVSPAPDDGREADDTRQLILDGIRAQFSGLNQNEVAQLIAARFDAADLPPPPASWLEAVAVDVAAGHRYVVSPRTAELPLILPGAVEPGTDSAQRGRTESQTDPGTD